jgi:hypothetical protein
MKKFLACVVFIALFCSGSVFAQRTANLGNALRQSATFLAENIPGGSTVLILNFQSGHAALADHIIDELAGRLANAGNLAVIGMDNLEALRQEMNLELSDVLNNELAQAIGKKLGANTIRSGSITPFGNDGMYRLLVRAIAADTAELQGTLTINILPDNTLAELTGMNQGRGTRARETRDGWTQEDRFDLGGKSVFALSPAVILIITPKFVTSLGGKITLYEWHYHGRWGASFFSSGFYTGRGGSIGSWGAEVGGLAKWRLDQQERFIFNAGLSVGWLAIWTWGYDGWIDAPSGGYYKEDDGSVNGLSIGLHTGLSFRVARNFSLDLNGSLRFLGEESIFGIAPGFTIMFPY